jgi:hypothetical protein
MICEYKEKISEIFDKYQYELADKTTLEMVDSEVVFYLYENGYNDDYNSNLFKPLIQNVNYKLSIEDINKIPYLQLELLEDGEWYVFN